MYWLPHLVPLVVVQCNRQACWLLLPFLSWYPQYMYTDTVTLTFKAAATSIQSYTVFDQTSRKEQKLCTEDILGFGRRPFPKIFNPSLISFSQIQKVTCCSNQSLTMHMRLSLKPLLPSKHGVGLFVPKAYEQCHRKVIVKTVEVLLGKSFFRKEKQEKETRSQLISALFFIFSLHFIYYLRLCLSFQC